MTHRRLGATAWPLAAVFLLATLLPAGNVLAGSSGDSPKDAQFYRLQWNMKAMRAHAAFSIGAEGAAEAADGNRRILVAIVDTGIDYEHPDLGIAVNEDGSAGNGGRVDLKLSKSLLLPLGERPTVCESEPGTKEPGTPYAPIAGVDEGLANPLGLQPEMDFHSHGTAIAGLVASNAQYLAGLTQQTTLFAVKAHGMSRINCLSVYLEAIRYAAEKGADVIHLSIPLDINMNDFPTARDRVNAMLDYAHEQGAVLVAAAGNVPTGGVNLDEDPAIFRFCEGNHVICLSATGPISADQVEDPFWDRIAAYSNYGSDIDVAGPGGTTAVPVTLTCSTHAKFGGAAQAPCRNGSYKWESTGTSFGAGATSGLAALLFRVTGSDDPGLIGQIIQQTADDLGDAGEDDFYGSGRINVKEAVDYALALP
jgi:subtilisin family serine protease